MSPASTAHASTAHASTAHASTAHAGTAHGRVTDLLVTGLGVTTPWTDEPAKLALENTPRVAVDDAWFDVATQLGPRGFKYLPPACRYLLAAARRAFGAGEPALASVPGQRRGVVVGTTAAATRLHAEMDTTIITSSASDLSPVLAPFFSINVFTSRLATAHDCRGFNVTLTTPAAAGLEAIGLGTMAIGLGRADAVLVGAGEGELPAGDPDAAAHHSGAGLLLLEPAVAARARGATAYGRCQTRTLFAAPDPAVTAARVASVAARLLGGAEVAGVHLVVDASPVGAAIEAGVARFPVRISRLVGGAGALLPVLVVAQLLATGVGTHLVVAGCGLGHVTVAVVECFGTGGSEGMEARG